MYVGALYLKSMLRRRSNRGGLGLRRGGTGGLLVGHAKAAEHPDQSANTHAIVLRILVPETVERVLKPQALGSEWTGEGVVRLIEILERGRRALEEDAAFDGGSTYPVAADLSHKTALAGLLLLVGLRDTVGVATKERCKSKGPANENWK